MLLICGVALKGLWPSIYYKHWLLIGGNCERRLVTSWTWDELHINIEFATLLIQKFVCEVKSLYCLRNMSYNLTCWYTLPIFCMIEWAPWSYSAFMLEDISGTFKRGFHGNHYIYSKFFIILWLKEKSANFLWSI